MNDYRLNLIHKTDNKTCARTLCQVAWVNAITAFDTLRTAYLQGLFPSTVVGVVLVHNRTNKVIKDCSKLHNKLIDY